VNTAEIFDRGYRKFEGERSGVFGAVRSLAWHTMRSILGLGRKARHKIFPVIVILIAFLPAVIFIGIAALFPGNIFGDEARPEYWELAQSSGFAILLFCAMVVPEALVRDRRDGMLGLYLSTPLTKATYLGGKVLAVMATLVIVTVGPALLLLTATTLESQGPNGIFDWVKTAGQIFLAGAGISAVFAAVAFAASSLTDRRAFASVATALIFIGSPLIVGALIDGADMSQNLRVFDVISMAFEFSPRVFGDMSVDLQDISDTQVFVADGAWTALGAAVVWLRYRRLGAA